MKQKDLHLSVFSRQYLKYDIEYNREDYQLMNNFVSKIKHNENKLLGGGAGSSQIKPLNNNDGDDDEIDKLQQDKFFDQIQKIDQKEFEVFDKEYEQYYTNDEVNDKVLENRIRKIIKVLHEECEHIYLLEIRNKVIDLINLVINYFVIVLQKKKDQSIQVFINDIDKQLKELKNTCYQNRKVYPCLDLYQYFDFLITLNSCRQGLDIANQSKIESLVQKALQLIKFGAGFTSIYGAINSLQSINTENVKQIIKEIIQICVKLSQPSLDIAQQAQESYESYYAGNLSKKIQAIWFRKVNVLREDFLDPHQQIIFYVKELTEVKNKGNDEIILFAYMQLNCLLQKQQQNVNLNEFSQKLKNTEKVLIFNFIEQLQLKKFQNQVLENIKKVADLIITSEQFRFLKIQLLLHFSQILQNINNEQQQSDKIMIYLYANYLQEKEISVKMAYLGSQLMKSFIQNIKQHYEKIVKESKQFNKHLKNFIKDEQQINKITNKIEQKEDIPRLLALNYIQMWEVSVKQSQDQKKIAHKDDILFEVIDLYIKQTIIYQQGYELFNNTDNQSTNNTECKDALKQIINKFLIPNYVMFQEKTQKQTSIKNNLANQESFPCKILSILAEGGSGKSMLLKKLEVELLKEDSEYITEERAKYIPFIIKCNSLEIEQPSIEKYLKSQNLSQIEINLLKRSERNKLIMLDGYDEYAGDYFKVYEKLQIYDWVNTIVIVTSRLERIKVSDAKYYFRYYDEKKNQGSNDSFSVVKLEKITEQDIKEYLHRYSQLQERNCKNNFNIQQHEQFSQIIFQKRQLLELLKLPINLYLITRMVGDIDLNDKNILNQFQDASEQVEIQELFFQQQFKKLSHAFVEKQFKMKTNETHVEEMHGYYILTTVEQIDEEENYYTIKRQEQFEIQKKELIQIVQSCYFEYFQTIAMHMFLQKGKKTNFLSTTKSSFSYQIRDEVSKYFLQNDIKIQDLIQNLQNYIDSRVITRIQLATTEENQNQLGQSTSYDQILEFEFRHKSLFEYFAARAMKYDFDLHQENIFKLNISQLKEFNINKRIIMTSQKNASEQQILLKLYRLIKSQIDSPSFKQSYSNQEISQTYRYIQYLKKSSISNYSQKSKIDVGSSNLLSVLFISKFSFPNLIFKKCSFSQAYITSHSRKVVDFQDCNFENAFIEKQHIQYFETSNTKNALLNTFQKQFDTDDIFAFNQVIFYKNYLVSISKTGFINQFEVMQNNVQSCKKLLSNQITQAPLKSIHFVDSKNLFVIRAQKSIFEVDPETFERINYFTFSDLITSLSVNNSKYVVTFSNNQILYGDIQNGFIQIDQAKIQADFSLSKNDFLVTSKNREINIYNMQNLQIIKSITNLKCSYEASSFSPDGKYLSIVSKYDNCSIFNVENGFSLIHTIEGLTICTAFSPNGKYLATGTSNWACAIWNAQKGFELIKTIQGYTKQIDQVIFSTDGTYMATCSFEQFNCKIWNVENDFELINQIQGHRDNINSVAFSADGKYLATASYDQTCKIWSVEKQFDLIKIIQEHTQSVTSVAFCSNSRFLATGSSDQTCKIWDLDKEFELVKTIQGHSKQISSVAFSTDRKFLATGSSDNTCKVWDIEKEFDLAITIQEHTDIINSIAFSADNRYLSTASNDNTCKIFEVEKQFQIIKTLEGNLHYIHSVVFCPKSQYLAAGCWGQVWKIWNVSKGFELMYSINQGHTNTIYSVAFSSNGKYFATGSLDNTCRVWNVEKEFELINTIQEHKDTVKCVAFSADGQQLITGSSDKTFKIWDLEKGFEFINIPPRHNSQIKQVAYSADGKYLATASNDFTCKIWDAKKGYELIKTIDEHNWYVSSVTFSSDGKYLATGSYDFTGKVWDIENQFELLYTFQCNREVWSVAFSKDSKYFATADYNRNCNIWNVDKEFELQNTIIESTNISTVDFSADGKYLATGTYDRTCKIWNVEQEFNLLHTLKGHTNYISSLAFCPNNKFLATGSWDYTCKIWNVVEGFELINTLVGNSENIYSVAFSADGKYLATAPKNKIQIWEVENGFKLINSIQGHTNDILSVAFSIDGQQLASGSYDKTCKIWNIKKGFQINEIDINNNFNLNDFDKQNNNQMKQIENSNNNNEQIFEI